MNNVFGHTPNEDPRRSKLFTSAPSNHQELIRPEPAPTPKKSSFTEPIMSARRELRLKHSKTRRNLLIGISIFIGLLLALVATDTIKLGTGPSPSLESGSSAITPESTSTAKVAGEKLESIRTPTTKDPLRVYIAGDSLIGSFASTLGTEFGETGVISATYDSRPSSGLVNTGFFNWFKHSKDIVNRYKPELVIFMIGTNDASIVSANPNGYATKYTEHLKELTDIYNLKKTKFVFVLAPSMKDTKLNSNVKKLNQVISLFAQSKNLQTIDAGDHLSPTGKFSTTIKQGTKTVNIRADDGVHISNTGGEILSLEIFQQIVEYYDLEKTFSLSPDDVKKPTKVKGCCTIATSTPSSSAKKSSSTSSTSTSAPTVESSTSTDTSTTETTSGL